MICPDCRGNGFIRVPCYSASEINYPTCEGQVEIPDVPPVNYCSACGEPLEVNQVWCEEHQGAALISEL